MLTEAEILSALRDCYDPELAINIVDLGLVHRVTLAPDPEAPGRLLRQSVSIDLILTSSESSSADPISAQIQNRLAGIRGLTHTQVHILYEPLWTPASITAAGNQQIAARRKAQPLVQISGSGTSHH